MALHKEELMKNKFFKKALSVFTAMAMALSLMTGIPFSELGLGITVSAETTTYDVNAKTIAGLGTSVIVDPTAPANDTDAWKGSYVYYGNYDADGDGTAEPVKYRVLDASTTKFGGTTMLLDCDSILYFQKFDNDGTANEAGKKANDWSISDVKSSLNGDGFLNKEGVFTTAEKNAIAASNVNSHALTTDSATGVNVASWTQSSLANYVALTGEQIFLLDAEDVSNGAYGYSMTDGDCENRKKTGSSGAYFWWLRSALNDCDDRAGYVTGYGSITDNHVSNMYTGVSPALNLNLSSVLFSSVISGTAGETGAEYKLTLLDGDMTIVASGDVTRNGKTVTVPYSISGGSSANATQVSVLVLDKEYTEGNTNGATVLDYQKLNVDSFSTSGTGTFALPSGLTGTLGTDYHIYLLAEHVNADNSTDYASEPVKVEKIYLDISEATAVQNGTLTYDGTAQTPTFTVTHGNTTLTADDYDVTVTAQTNAGSYTATITGKGNYSGTIADVAWEILPANIDVPSMTYAPLTYNGAEQAPVFTIKLGNATLTADDYDVTVTAQTNAGSYTATITGKGNYRGTISNVTWSIGKATPTVTAPTAKTGLVYTGTAQALIAAGSTDFGTLLYSLDDNDYSENIPTATDAGTYTVYYMVQGNSNVNNVEAQNFTVSIGKVPVTITAESYTIKVDSELPTFDYKVTGLVNNENIEDIGARVVVSCKNGDGGVPSAVGEYEIVVSGETETTNYKLTYVDGTLTITDKEEIQTITAADVTLSYGNTGKKIGATASGGEITYAVKTGEDVIKVDDDGTITTLKAGTAIVEITAAANDDYGKAIKAVAVKVNKAAVTIKANSYTVKVGGDFPALDYTVTGLADGESLGVSPELSCETDNTSTAGTYKITVKFNLTEDDKYIYTVQNGALTVQRKSAGGAGGSSGGARPTTPTSTNPSIGGTSKSWSDVAADLGKLTSDSEATIELNGSTTVPVDVIKSIADTGSNVKLVVNSAYSWIVDGADITAPAAADLKIAKTTSTKSGGLRGIEGTQFKINNTNIPTDLEISFKASHAGKFANLYKNVDGKLTFVTCAKLGADGKAVLNDVAEKGDYVSMLCEYSDRPGDMDNDGIMNAKDSLAIIKDFIGLEKGVNPLVADINNDGFINAKDSLMILKKTVGLA